MQPLNYIEYNKKNAMELLKNLYGWMKYEHKHYESRFTKFYEGYWLLKNLVMIKESSFFKFNIDKSNDPKGSDGKLDYYPISDDEINNEFNFISQKLDISENELKLIMQEKINLLKITSHHIL